MIDRFIQPIFMLIGPVVMAFAVVKQEWLFAGILLAWWLVSRFVRVFGYFKTYPKRLIYLPAYILYGYANAIVKVYAFATLIENSWATRWAKGRAARKSLFRKAYTLGSGYAAVAIFLVFITQIVLSLRATAGANVPVPPPVDSVAVKNQLSKVSKAQEMPAQPAGYVDPQSVQTYTVQYGDSLATLSLQFGMGVSDLKRLNNIVDADEISAGQTLIYYKGTIR
jgi:hypothetical protein